MMVSATDYGSTQQLPICFCFICIFTQRNAFTIIDTSRWSLSRISSSWWFDKSSRLPSLLSISSQSSSTINNLFSNFRFGVFALLALVLIVKFIEITTICYLRNLYSRDSLSFLATAFVHSVYFQCPLLICLRLGSVIMYHQRYHCWRSTVILLFGSLIALHPFISLARASAFYAARIDILSLTIPFIPVGNNFT